MPLPLFSFCNSRVFSIFFVSCVIFLFLIIFYLKFCIQLFYSLVTPLLFQFLLGTQSFLFCLDCILFKTSFPYLSANSPLFLFSTASRFFLSALEAFTMSFILIVSVEFLSMYSYTHCYFCLSNALLTQSSVPLMLTQYTFCHHLLCQKFAFAFFKSGCFLG